MTLTFTVSTTILHRSSIHSYTKEYKTRLILYIDCIAKSKKKKEKERKKANSTTLLN